MKTHANSGIAGVAIAFWISLALSFSASSQSPIDCNCVTNLPALETNNCPAHIPDLCSLAANCFGTNMLPGSCVQNIPAGSLAGPGTNNLVLAVQDSQSNFVFCLVSFIVIPPPNPTLSLLCSSNKTVQCGSEWMFDTPVVITTCCDPMMTVAVVGDVTNGVCPQLITRTWQVTNSCGLSATCNQTVTVIDTTPPTTLCSGVNLVPNGDFEFHTACPSQGGQLALAAPWFPATAGTCDYYNPCATLSFVSVPTNGVGNQVPLSGVGYSGIFLYGTDPNVPGSSYREYMEVPLVVPLTAGQTYQVSFHMSRAENYASAVANVGAYFSGSPILSNSYTGVLNFVPQVTNALTNILLSTTSWMLVQGTFVASGGESYMTLGNFLPDAGTTAIPASGLYSNTAYYYFDDVSVTALCPATVTNKSVPCGSPLTFDLPAAFDNCSGTNVAVTVLGTVTNGICPRVATRTWLLTDLCGNTNTWSQSITLVDNTPPTINCACLQDSALFLLNTNGCSGIVPDLSHFTNCFSGSCGPVTCSQSPPAGTMVGAGTHPVTLNVINCSGLSNQCTVPFVVNDGPPIVNCPPNLYLVTCSTSAVANFAPTAIGNVGPIVCSPPSGSAFPLGTNLVTCTATNSCGGIATCTFRVVVRPYSVRWGCLIHVIAIPFTPIGTAIVVFLPTLGGGVTGAEIDDIGTTGQDGIHLDFGPAQKFTFQTVLDFGAAPGAGIAIAAPPTSGGTAGTQLASFSYECQSRCGWNLRLPVLAAADPAANYRTITVNTNGELLASFVHDAANLGTNALAFLSPAPGVTGAVVSVTVDCLTGEIDLAIPNCTWTRDAARKGWDGLILADSPRGSIAGNPARLTIAPLPKTPPAPLTGLNLTGSNVVSIPFDNPSMTVAGRNWSGAAGAALKAYDDGHAQGIEMLSLNDSATLSAELGYAAGLQFRIQHFEDAAVPNPSQQFNFSGPTATGTGSGGSPLTNSLLFASSTSGAGIDCFADFTQWGVSNATVQLWNGSALVAQQSHVPSSLSLPVATIAGFPSIINCPAIGTISISDTNPIIVTGGMLCSGGCSGTELRIIAELPPKSSVPVVFTGFTATFSNGMDDLIYGFQMTPACTPVPLTVSVTPGGIMLNWTGDGFRLQGAENISGPWYDLGVISPVSLPVNSDLRVFRLICN